MKKGICTGILPVFICALFASQAAMASKKIVQSSCPKTAARISFLFTVPAGNATLKHIKSRKYTLTMPLKDVEPVLVFTDRPNRMAFRVKPEVFAKGVHSSNNSFDKNPPNVVLTWGDNKEMPYMYTITDYRKGPKNLVYMLTYRGKDKRPAERKRGRVTLFIDSFDFSSYYDQDTAVNIHHLCNVTSLGACVWSSSHDGTFTGWGDESACRGYCDFN